MKKHEPRSSKSAIEFHQFNCPDDPRIVYRFAQRIARIDDSYFLYIKREEENVRTFNRPD